MTRWIPLLLLASALFAACPKKVNTEVLGSDDEQMDKYGAQLEELRTRVEAQPPKCNEWCSLSQRACDISKNLCEIAGRHADRNDMQQRCVTSQEDCARFNDSCAGCK
jgi:hypothetical protein